MPTTFFCMPSFSLGAASCSTVFGIFRSALPVGLALQPWTSKWCTLGRLQVFKILRCRGDQLLPVFCREYAERSPSTVDADTPLTSTDAVEFEESRCVPQVQVLRVALCGSLWRCHLTGRVRRCTYPYYPMLQTDLGQSRAHLLAAGRSAGYSVYV